MKGSRYKGMMLILSFALLLCGCAAELFAFSFDFHGNTQVPNPAQLSNMLDERVDG